MGRPSAELLEAVNELAAQNGWSPQDILTIYSYETGGTMNPWQKGPTTKWGEHRGLIQWGEPQRQKYGVSADTPVREQVMATGRYWKDRGAKPGMGILPLYAAVNGGNVNKTEVSYEAAGGAPGTVREKVNNQMEGHRKNAYAWTDSNYVPPESTRVPMAGRSSNTYHHETLGQVPPPEPEPELTKGEQFVADVKDAGMAELKSAAGEGIKSLIFGTGSAPTPPPIQLPAPPPMMPTRAAGKIELRKRRKT